jgi:hypothetical protein
MSKGLLRRIDQYEYTMSCPECGKKWGFDDWEGEQARKVDAGLHWKEHHKGPIPDDAHFGNYQCPQCLELHGLDGTVSCSECGWIPEKVRA